ncbi:hypothetical protein PLICRDRAFT_180919 [Plicaturopsis crispa FD-325 SS-3]|uniref:Ribonuclease H1 N-terminal domain-containing protein n=1 Tax=Plicaturopsis crispa FD-325 SS-3 TaxID=944288 RepID=A0A0C9T162_PLICR|nr:hypothetical protein PLICRDRAFT_180919 [Plicaturopsis crispa FD-325 SS-3]
MPVPQAPASHGGCQRRCPVCWRFCWLGPDGGGPVLNTQCVSSSSIFATVTLIFGAEGQGTAAPATSRWYCVIRGRKVGVFEGWMTTSPLVTGVPHCQFCRFTTRDDAVRAFNAAIDEGQVYETGE